MSEKIQEPQSSKLLKKRNVTLEQFQKIYNGEPLNEVLKEKEKSNITNTVNEKASINKRMLKGSLWMTIGGISSRILGALYIIPWIAMIGNQYSTDANSLFAQGYQIYSIFLIIATAGLPNVVSRLIAEYYANYQFKMIKKTYHFSLVIGVFFGVVVGTLLYLMAPFLSQGDNNVVLVLHALAIAVSIIPILSMLRGYVQGYEFMGITALSQFIEQLIRVIYMLSMTYWIMILHHGTWIDATVQSTFAAFWGALAGIIILIIGIYINRNTFNGKNISNKNNEVIENNTIIKQMLKQSIPIVFVISASSILQIINQYTFFKIMKNFTTFNYGAINDMFAQFSFNSNKLVMLVVSLAAAMSETALPMIAKSNTLENKENVAIRIEYALKLLLFVIIPASIGMAAVSKPLYLLFYGINDFINGTLILQYASYTAIIMGLYMVIISILQGIRELKYTMKILIVIILVKLIIQVPIVILFAGIGPLMSTMIAMTIGIFMALQHIKSKYPISLQRNKKTLSKIMLFSIIVYIVVCPIVNILDVIMNSNSKFDNLIIIIIGGLIGASIYVYLSLRYGIGKEILGNKADRLAQKLKIKKAS